MGDRDNKRKQLKLLLKQAEITEDLIESHFKDAVLDKVELSRKNKQWIFHLSLDDLIPATVLDHVITEVTRKLQHIALIDFVFKFNSS